MSVFFLGYDFGHYIVGVATLIIFVMALTGLILWWPRNKAALKQRLWFRWKETTKWRRKNYDVHNIGGFYTWIVVLFLAATGLVWTFQWWENGIYRLLGEKPEQMFAKTAPTITKHSAQVAGVYERILNDSKHRIPNWNQIDINLLEIQLDSAQAISAIIKYNTRSGWDEWDSYTFNSKTGKVYYTQPQAGKQLGEKWRTSNYAIHTGSIYGLPSKILVSVASLICATLPISGFLIW